MHDDNATDDGDDTREILWKNVQTLMIQLYGEENLGKIDTAAANMTRVKAQKTDVSLKVLRDLSRSLGVPVWQLLTPNLGAHLHVIKGTQVVPLFDMTAIQAGATSQPHARSPSAGRDGKFGFRHFKADAAPQVEPREVKRGDAKAPHAGKRQDAAAPKKSPVAGRKV